MSDSSSEFAASALVPAHVSPKRVLQWIATGWALFMKAPAIWALHALIVFVVLAALGMLPLLGWAAAPIVLPVLIGGMLSGAQALQRDEALRIDHLFDGIRRHPGPLLALGGLHLLGALLAALMAAAISGSAVLTGMVVGALPGVGVATVGVMFGALVFTVLWALLMMALWFAPALVMLDGAAPLNAIALSARAALRNPLAFIVLGAVLYVLIWVAMLPAGLGMLILLPVMVGALYAAWQDTFVPLIALPPPAAPSPPSSTSSPAPSAPAPPPADGA